jgi:hypothetical protein
MGRMRGRELSFPLYPVYKGQAFDPSSPSTSKGVQKIFLEVGLICRLLSLPKFNVEPKMLHDIVIDSNSLHESQ